MWGFFKRKKSGKLSKEERIEIYTRNKEEVLRKSKELLSNFQYDFEFVSEDLQHVLILDKLSRKIAFIQLSSTGKEPKIVALNDINSLGIRYDSREIGIDRFWFIKLEKQYDPVECAKQIVPETMSTVYNISLYFRQEMANGETEEILVPFFNKETSVFNYFEKHEELKTIYQYLITCLIEDERLTRKELIKQASIEHLQSKIIDLEKKVESKGMKKDESVSQCMPLLSNLELTLKEYISTDPTLEFELCVDIDIHMFNLSIKGFRNNRVYIGCNFKPFENSEVPEIKGLIIRIIELYIQDNGFKEVSVISSQSELEDALLLSDTSIQEMLAREILQALKWRNEIFGENCRYRTFCNDTLYFDYDNREIFECFSVYQIKWDKERFPILEYLIGNQSINVAFVPPNHSIEFIPVENIERIWETIIRYEIEMGDNQEDCNKPILLSKAHSYENGVLSIYKEKQSAHLYNDLQYDLKRRIEYAFFIHTGLFLDEIEVIENPEIEVEDSENMPQEVVDWISGLESKPYTLFEVFDFRHINEEIYVLMDNKVYVGSRIYGSADVKYRLPNEPSMETLTKRWLRINGGHISLGEWHYNFYHEEFASSIRKYLTDLDQVQKNQMEPWKQKCMENNTIQTLFERFYQKKVKPLINATYLDDILDDTVDLNDEIEIFTQFLMKRNYIEGDEFLVGVFVRERVVENAISDFSETFNLHNGVHFENIPNMTLTECLQAFHAVDFAMIENREDVANFMCFLLKNNKIELDVTYQDLQEKLTNMLMQEGEGQMLQDYESYLLAEEEDNVSITLEGIDEMDGYQFEEFVAQLFQDMGYKTEVTSSSGDYGIDVIAKRKGLTIGIQAKRYSDKVPNKAVQEVIAGIAYYKLDQGLVITNNYFTKQAQNQAKSTNVMLWDRNMLQQKLHEMYGNIENH